MHAKRFLYVDSWRRSALQSKSYQKQIDFRTSFSCLFDKTHSIIVSLTGVPTVSSSNTHTDSNNDLSVVFVSKLFLEMSFFSLKANCNVFLLYLIF